MLINNSGASHYSFNSVSTHTSVINGKRQSTTEAVSVRNGNGMKTVMKRKGKKTSKSKHHLTHGEVQNIMDRKFMPSLFTPCHEDCERILNAPPTKKRKLRQTKKRVKSGSK